MARTPAKLKPLTKAEHTAMAKLMQRQAAHDPEFEAQLRKAATPAQTYDQGPIPTAMDEAINKYLTHAENVANIRSCNLGAAPNIVTGHPFGTVAATLDERGERYGDFTDHARLSDKLIQALETHQVPGKSDVPTVCIPWDHLGSVKRQALRVVCDKLARILNGDPNYADNWHDIQGYAKLVEDRLK